ncbi:MAG: hypothetical protein H7A21_12320 [Spirochaetales bacterium]|nr:hypothetical protein [Leptospiraceae bacterium]MCP5482213.1 hypothetical protein [Spirochaetales bacterium]MCP5484675.1 hypothetical protein [Spirochaetales bacterium]
MSLYTVDLQVPRGQNTRLLDILNAPGVEPVSANLLYSDPRSTYYRVEISTADDAQTLEALLKKSAPDSEFRVRSDTSLFEGNLIDIVPGRSIDFRRSFIATSPTTIEEVATRRYAQRTSTNSLTGNRIGLLSDGSGLEAQHHALLRLERDAFLLARHTDLQPIPLWLETRNEEEFIKTAVALSVNFFALRITGLSRDYAMDVCERLEEQVQIPVIHGEAIETAVMMAAILENAVRHFQATLEDKVAAVIGLGPAGHGLKNFLARLGLKKIYGIDADFRQLTRFERVHGIASSIDAVYDSADFIIVTPGYRTTLDPKRFRPGQIILCFSPGVVQRSELPAGVSDRFFEASEPHPVFVLPGLLGALHTAGRKRLMEEDLRRILQTLAVRPGDPGFLPVPSADLFRAQFRSLG